MNARTRARRRHAKIWKRIKPYKGRGNPKPWMNVGFTANIGSASDIGHTKGETTISGLLGYDLAPAAKKLTPLLIPFSGNRSIASFPFYVGKP